MFKDTQKTIFSLAVFMFKKNPKKQLFLWATDEGTPLKKDLSYAKEVSNAREIFLY